MASAASSSRPGPGDVALRLVVLKRVAAYGLAAPPRPVLAQAMQSWTREERGDFVRDAEDDRDAFWGEACAQGLWEHLSPAEQAFALSTAATMTAEQQADASWRIEAVQVLAWALGLIERMPPFDALADHALLVGVGADDIAGFVATARLRPEHEIAAARDTAEFWHWRSRTRQMIEQGLPFEAPAEGGSDRLRCHDDIVRVAARHAAAEGVLPGCIDGDFPALGKAYRDLSDDEWAEVTSVTIERHVALNWLCGLAPGNRWDETPTGT